MWDGPVNERAYAERDIYEQVSDEDGKAVRVRIVCGQNAKQGNKRYQKLYLYVRFSENMAAYPGNLNLKIEVLLEKYRKA